MPTVTHSVIDPVGGQPVGVRSVEVGLAPLDPLLRVYRASDGAEVAPVEAIEHEPDSNGQYPSTWTIVLLDTDGMLPAGTRYRLRQVLEGDDPAHPRPPLLFTVPRGGGPYRLVDLLDDPGYVPDPDPGGEPDPGPDPAPSGPQSHTHTQTLPASVWLILHPLAFDPAGVEVHDPDGGRLYPRRTSRPAPGRVRLDFTRPVAGTALLS